MVDPRIYRAGLALVVVAVIVFGFSLQNEPAPMSASLAPGQAFSSAPGLMKKLANDYPNRQAGSTGDDALASYVAGQLSKAGGFSVSSRQFMARTALGERMLTTVIAQRTGLSGGTVVVVSHRDTPQLGTAASLDANEADLSGTAVLLKLAQALSGSTLNHTVMLVSTSGQVGAAGAAQLAASLSSQPVDAVITLGDLAGARVLRPVVVPWSTTEAVAPVALQRTVQANVAQQAGIKASGPSLDSQLAHLAFPFSITEQGPLISAGIPAVQLSVSGDRLTPAAEPIDPARVAALGNAVLQSVNALENGPPSAAPSTYLTLSGKIVPLWAVRLLVLALILPVGISTIDSLARARRRGHSLIRWVAWVLAGASPFIAGLVALVVARLIGALTVPAGAVGSDALPIGTRGTLVMVAVAVIVVGSFWLLRPLCLRFASTLGGGRAAARRATSPAIDGAAVALSIVMCALALVMWVVNPFAAVLLVPALHLWLWLAERGVHARRPVVLTLVLIALVAPVLLILYYAQSLGLSPLGLLWSGVLFVAGGGLSAVSAVLWSLVLGALASALVLAVRVAPSVPVVEEAGSVRGPASYAGPGSLGGTESALRR
jgi:hypothetical protein